MKTFDENKLDTLLSKKDFINARAYVEDFFRNPETPLTEADVAIDYAHMYLKMMNRINKRYLESLKSLESMLEEANIAESKANDALKLASVKKGLGLGHA